MRAYDQFNKTLLGQAAVPFDLKPGSWHHVKTVVTGNQVSVSIDDQSILTFTFKAGGFFGIGNSGSVGFGNQQGAEALFRNLSVVHANAAALYTSSLTNPSVLDDFAIGTNRLPSILDGAKRDRYVWAGDIGISGLTILYASGAGEYIAGSLQLTFPPLFRANAQDYRHQYI